MVKIFLITVIFTFTFFGMNCNPPADYKVVGGKKLAFDGYDKEFEKLRIVIQSGINKSSAKRLEKNFVVSHRLEKDSLLDVTSATLEAKGKKFDGKILSTVFNDKSRFPKNNGGYMSLEWTFDEPLETLFEAGFSIVFKTKLEGRDESAAMQFEPVNK